MDFEYQYMNTEVVLQPVENTALRVSAPFGPRRTDRRRFHANVRALPLDGRIPPASGIVDDISEGGAFISSIRQLPQGVLVLLQIYTLQAPHRLELMARVVHSRAGEGYGCQFVDMDELRSRQLIQVVERNVGHTLH